MEQPSIPVSSSVTLGLVTTGPGGSSARWASVTTRQGALEGGGDNLRGQVEVVPQVLDTLVGQVPEEFILLNPNLLGQEVSGMIITSVLVRVLQYVMTHQ